MPAYIKMRKAIETQLQQKRKELVETVTARYNAVFDELEKYAEEMHVSRDKFARRDTTISLNTGTNNFYALQANADTSSFYEEQMHRINAAIPSKPYTPPTPPDNGGGSVHDDGGQPAPPQSRPRVRKIVRLNTHTTEPMHTEADVDRYLQSLKAQLMRYINEDNDIIVS